MTQRESATGTDVLGLEAALAVRLVDGLLDLGLPPERMAEVLAYEFGMQEPSSSEQFWSLVSSARQRVVVEGLSKEPSAHALIAVLAKVMRRQTGLRIPAAARRGDRQEPQRRRRAADDHYGGPGITPDYSGRVRYPASSAELLVSGADSVDGLVAKVNALCARAGKPPVAETEFPSSRKKFFTLVVRLSDLVERYGEADEGALLDTGIASTAGNQEEHDMDAQQRLDRIARHLAEQFSGGVDSISVEDVTGDGALVSKEIDSVLRTPLARTAKGRLENVVDALSTIGSVWRSGFDLASAKDYVTDEQTVSEVICEYVGSLSPTATPTP